MAGRNRMETWKVGTEQGRGDTIDRAQHDAGMANACATKTKEQINMAQETFGGIPKRATVLLYVGPENEGSSEDLIVRRKKGPTRCRNG